MKACVSVLVVSINSLPAARAARLPPPLARAGCCVVPTVCRASRQWMTDSGASRGTEPSVRSPAHRQGSPALLRGAWPRDPAELSGQRGRGCSASPRGHGPPCLSRDKQASPYPFTGHSGCVSTSSPAPIRPRSTCPSPLTGPRDSPGLGHAGHACGRKFASSRSPRHLRPPGPRADGTQSINFAFGSCSWGFLWETPSTARKSPPEFFYNPNQDSASIYLVHVPDVPAEDIRVLGQRKRGAPFARSACTRVSCAVRVPGDTCTRGHSHGHMCTLWTHAHTHAWIHVQTHIQAHSHMDTCTHLDTWSHTCTHTCTRA